MKRAASQSQNRRDEPDAAEAPSVAVRTVSLVSLGCPKNTVDSEKMLGLLAEAGFVPISADPARDLDPADAVVINTCGFLEAAKEESLDVIRRAIRAKQRGDVGRVVVAGCLVQRHRARLLDWAPGIDALIGVFDRDRISAAVGGQRPPRPTIDEASDGPAYWIAGNALKAAEARGMRTVGLTVRGADGKGIGYFEDDSARLRITPRHYAYLRVSEGCNQNCAFCTIPSIRGKMRSKPIDKVTAEARELVLDGAFELNLIGQDTTSYGDDLGIGLGSANVDAGRFDAGLPLLLRSVCDAVRAGAGSGWVRLMYAYPSNFTDRIIDAFAELCESGPLIPYIDMPLQHASDRILAAMRRHVTGAHQRRLLERLRERIPGLALRTTLITGFPGETEDDHQRLLDFVEETGFDALGVFEFSPEPGTRAATMNRDPALAVPSEVKSRRRDEIMRLQQRIAFEQAAYLAEQFDPRRPENTGCRFDVLIDSAADEIDSATDDVGPARGRCYFQAPQVDSVTLVRSRASLAPGELVRCIITGSDGYDLIATPEDDLRKARSLPVLG